MAPERIKPDTWSVAELKVILQVEIVNGTSDRTFTGVAIDSRTVRTNELFVALRGEHTDGHLFIEDAVRHGASAVLVDRTITPPGDVTVLRVENTRLALESWGRWVREHLTGTVIGITGSAGKTTTKELLAWVCQAWDRTFASPGNLNSTTGVPLSLINYGRSNPVYWIQETGLNHPGEMDRIGSILQPDVAVLLNALPVHLEGLHDISTVAREKAKLVRYLRDPGTVISNADDRELKHFIKLNRKSGTRWIEWSPTGASAAVQVHDVQFHTGGLRFRLLYQTPDNRQESIELNYPGWIPWLPYLAGGVAATLYALEIPLTLLRERLPAFQPPPHRGHVHVLDPNVIIFDDSYNANPAAVKMAVNWFRFQPDHRHVLVLGDMLELGSASETLHRQLAHALDWSLIDVFIAVGPRMVALVDELKKCGNPVEIYDCPDAYAARNLARRIIQPHDAWLIKGSRGVQLDIVVEALLSTFPYNHSPRSPS